MIIRVACLITMNEGGFMPSNQRDFTHGNIFKSLFFFSGPIMLTNLLQSSFQIIASLWVGNLLGAHALGAVAISTTILLTMLSFIIGLNNAVLTILSQFFGKKDYQGLKQYLNAFVVVMTTMAIIFGALGFIFSKQLLLLMGTPESLLGQANTYLQISFLGILFLFGYNFVNTVSRALGDSKTPMRIVFLAVVLNAFLAPLFIGGFKLGIAGAALSTVVSQGLAFIYSLYHSMKHELVPFTIPKVPSIEQVLLILKLGIPAGLQMAVIQSGNAAILSVVTQFGGDTVAGFSASQRLDSLIMLPAMALGTAVNSMAGQNIGVGDWKRVRQIAKVSALYNFMIMTTIALIVILVADVAIRFFIQDPEAVNFGSHYLRIVALCYPFLGLNFVFNGIVRASGAMYQVLILNIISFWILRFPLTELFSKMFGQNGIAIGMGIGFIISSIFAVSYYQFGKWDQKVITEENK